MKSLEKTNDRLQSALLEIQKLPKSKGRRYSKHHQAVVSEAFRTGMSLADIQRLSSIPLVTLRSWRVRAFDNNFVQLSVPESKPKHTGAQASLIINESVRIELAVEDITVSLIQRLKQAV